MSTQYTAVTHKHIDGIHIHDDCHSFLPAPSGVFTPIHAVGGTTTSIPTSRITPITSSMPARRVVTRSTPVFSQLSALEQPSPLIENDFEIPSPTNPPIDIQLLIPENAFLYERQSPRDNVTEFVDAAARNLRRRPLANTSKMQLRPNTSSQRKT